MSQNYKKGASSLLIIFIVIILGLVAYSIFKNRNTIQIEPETTKDTSNTTENTGIQRASSQNKQTNQITQENTAELSSQDIAALEQETTDVEKEINDLMFEDLAVE